MRRTKEERTVGGGAPVCGLVARRRARRPGTKQLGTVALIGMLAACGPDDVASGDRVCEPGMLDDSNPVEISAQWDRTWDDVGAPALLESWDEATPGVELAVNPSPAGEGLAAMLEDGTSPTVIMVDHSMVGDLAEAGAIQPFDTCLDAAGASLDPMLPEALALGQVDGRLWGAPANLDTLALLYDRNAFQAAGLDPAAPPRDLEELHAAATAIREATGIPHPIAGLAPSTALLTTDMDSSGPGESGLEPPPALDGYRALLEDDLLLAPPGPDELPPLGSGAAALQIVNTSQLWGYAAALADGQAPDADLAIASLPGARAASTPVLGGVWVLNANATPEQAMGAASLVAWLSEPQQQARLHPLTDRFPVSIAGGDDPVAQEYWRDLPLLGELWRLLSAEPASPARWTAGAGALQTADVVLDRHASTPTATGDAWPELMALVGDSDRAPDPLDARLRLSCLLSDPEPDLVPVCLQAE
jgi:ABC-type glycerol-3-phosphate transport system substrate-binding protein